MVWRLLCSVLRVWILPQPFLEEEESKGTKPSQYKVFLHTFSFKEKYAPLAQLVEHLTLNQGVQGSSP